MNRPRLIRWLRVAVSAVCLVVCVGLVGLWVRSYSKDDIKGMTGDHLRGDHWRYVDFQHKRMLGLWSQKGEITLSVTNRVTGRGSGFAANNKGGLKSVSIPHWSLVLLSAALAYVPWLPWWSTQFSLKALLIVTAVIAGMLGLGVWLTR